MKLNQHMWGETQHILCMYTYKRGPRHNTCSAIHSMQLLSHILYNYKKTVINRDKVVGGLHDSVDE